VTPTERVIERLEQHDCLPRGGPEKGWDARCPAHDDRDPSFHLGEGHDGRALVTCHAGCTTEQICAALGLTVSDLFPETDSSSNGKREIATYGYVDEDGTLLYEVVRYDPKNFKQRRPDGKGDWIWKLDDTRRVLYRLPEVLAAVEAGERIYVVEGEKGVHALEKLGKVATCNPGGAGKWRPEFSEFLRGAEVVIVADRDDTGRKHAEVVRAALDGVAASVRVVGAATGKDASDHLAAGHTLDDPKPVGQGSGPRRRTGDISGAAFALDAPTRIASIWGSGTNVLWAAGEPALLYGPDGVGKTTLTQQLVLRLVGIGPPRLLGHAVPRAEGKVLYLALDRHPQAARSMRRMVTEQDRETLDERFVVWQGTAPFDLVRHPESLAEFAHERGAGVVVIDSLKDIAPKLSDEDTGGAINRAWQLCVEAGVEVLSLHHPRKAQADNKKPRTLADVYGSRWLTAGCGSVLLLWGDAGDPVVELGISNSPPTSSGP
jgi:hypothetical protein